MKTENYLIVDNLVLFSFTQCKLLNCGIFYPSITIIISINYFQHLLFSVLHAHAHSLQQSNSLVAVALFLTHLWRTILHYKQFAWNLLVPLIFSFQNNQNISIAAMRAACKFHTCIHINILQPSAEMRMHVLITPAEQ